MEDHRGVAHRLHVGEVVGADEHRDAAGPRLDDDVADDATSHRVHAGGGLVQEERGGSGQERDREAEPLALTAREPAPRRPRAPRQVEQLHEAVGVFGVLVVAREQRERLARRQRGPDPAVLEHGPDAPDDVAVLSDRVAPEHPDDPRVGASVAEERLDAGGLARAVRPEQREHLPGADGEVDAVDGGERAVADGERDRLDHRVRHALNLGRDEGAQRRRPEAAWGGAAQRPTTTGVRVGATGSGCSP